MRFTLKLAIGSISLVASLPAFAATFVTPTGFDAVEGNSGSRNVLGFINVARMQQVFSTRANF